MRYEDLATAVDAVLAHDGFLQNRVVSGVVSSQGEHPLYLTGADGDEYIGEAWFQDHAAHPVHPRPDGDPARPRAVSVL